MTRSSAYVPKRYTGQVLRKNLIGDLENLTAVLGAGAKAGVLGRPDPAPDDPLIRSCNQVNSFCVWVGKWIGKKKKEWENKMEDKLNGDDLAAVAGIQREAQRYADDFLAVFGELAAQKHSPYSEALHAAVERQVLKFPHSKRVEQAAKCLLALDIEPREPWLGLVQRRRLERRAP